MELIIKTLTTLAGPRFAKWLVGTLAGLGGILALFVARRRGRAQGRAEVLADNARAKVRRQAELSALRDAQAKAAAAKPDEVELTDILDEGRF